MEKNFDMTYFFYYITNLMLKSLEVIKDKINIDLREDIILKKVKEKKIDLNLRQKKIIEILSNKNESFMMTLEHLKQKVKFDNKLLKRDLEILIDFNLIEKIITVKGKIYFKLNVDFR